MDQHRRSVHPEWAAQVREKGQRQMKRVAVDRRWEFWRNDDQAANRVG